MLSIIYQTPMGLIEADIDGKIIQMNAKGIQLLMPLFVNNNLTGENINELLEIEAPEVLDSVKKFKNKSTSSRPIGSLQTEEINNQRASDLPIFQS